MSSLGWHLDINLVSGITFFPTISCPLTITHLQVLTDYLDLYGKNKTRKLPNGTSKPPHEDPQILLGALKCIPHPIPSPITSELDDYKSMHHLTTQDNTHLNQLGNWHSHCFTIIINSQPSMRNKHIHMHPRLQEVSHPLFTHLTQHIYQIKSIDYLPLLSTWIREQNTFASMKSFVAIMMPPTSSPSPSATLSPAKLGMWGLS